MARRVAFLPLDAPFREHLNERWPESLYVIRRETIDGVEGWAIYDA